MNVRMRCTDWFESRRRLTLCLYDDIHRPVLNILRKI